MSHPPQDYNTTAENGSKFAVTTLSARIGAMVSFIVAVAVFQTNDAKIGTGYVTVTFKHFRSYQYGYWVALIGLGYTVLQIPMAMHYVMKKKHLINSNAFLKFDFYADKVAAFVVATAAGAAFGATMDLKKNITWKNDDDNKVQSFLTVTYIAAAFLLLGSISCWISSLHSSLALTHKLITQQF